MKDFSFESYLNKRLNRFMEGAAPESVISESDVDSYVKDQVAKVEGCMDFLLDALDNLNPSSVEYEKLQSFLNDWEQIKKAITQNTEGE